MGIPMDIGSLLGTLLLAALVMGVVVMMPIAIGRNLVRGHAYRNRLDNELSGLRLSKMLRFLGIDKAAYLHRQPSVEIREHMEKCDSCGDKALCDDTLAGNNTTAEVDLSFCANIDSLQALEKEAKPVSC
ncbi:MAG: DUF6455 family protein [Gammaproteobacteria bacterium]|jgi:hypothetical protein